MKSKTLILSSIAKEHDGRGILTLYQEDDLLKCKLRLYNTAELTAYCKLGIYHKKEVFTANLLNKSGQYESSFVGDFDIDADFYCAIIDTKNNNNVILAGGTYAGYYFNDTAVFDTKSATDDEAEQQETIQPETTCEDCDKCKNCKYKEYFYSEQNLHLQKTTEKETETKKDCDILTNTTKDLKQDETQNQAEKLASILDSIIPQFKYVFENYPADEDLNKLLQNSKFVKITEDQQQYSIGAIYEQDIMKYICYATKCNYNTPAPEELGNHYQWLPLDKEDPLSEGYYLVFQDTKDLKILEI